MTSPIRTACLALMLTVWLLPTAEATSLSPNPAACATPDLDALKAAMRTTRTVSIFGKIRLNFQVDALIGDFQEWHAGKKTHRPSALRRRFNHLMTDILASVRSDPCLHSRLVATRATFWRMLNDPLSFGLPQRRAGRARG